MKTIDTLADDIKAMFTDANAGTATTLTEQAMAKFGAGVALAVNRSLEARRVEGRKPRTLYMSEIGQPCKRKLWYGYHQKALAEPMQGHTLFKFLYGDIIEETALLLAEAAGHTVELRQQPIEILLPNDWKVRGRIDAVVDGVLVDVKGVSPFGYKKFEEGLTDDNDSFGYRGQLAGYNYSGSWERQGFLAIDKQNGKVGFFEQATIPAEEVMDNALEARSAVDRPAAPPRAFDAKPEGTSGNMKLGVECSYCPYKQVCWRDSNGGKGLRAFAYSYGPVFLTEVKREPKVTELTLTTITT